MDFLLNFLIWFGVGIFVIFIVGFMAAAKLNSKQDQKNQKPDWKVASHFLKNSSFFTPFRFLLRLVEKTGEIPALSIREGETIVELKKLIEEEKNINVLVLKSN